MEQGGQVWRTLDAPRAPSEHERRLLHTLAGAVVEPLLHEQVSSVVIDAVCRCGCSSVRLRSAEQAVPPDRVVELSGRRRSDYFSVQARGRGRAHRNVTVVLHVMGGRVGELEIFDGVKGEGTAVDVAGLTRLTTPTHD